MLPSISPRAAGRGSERGHIAPAAGFGEAPRPNLVPDTARETAVQPPDGPLRPEFERNKRYRKRRYFFGKDEQSPRCPLPLYYDVLLHGEDGVDTGAEDHLRYRYVDFVCPPPSSWHDRLKSPRDGLGLDVRQLSAFFTQAEPWTRLDAYPMYVIVKDLLLQQLAGTLEVADREGDRLRTELAQSRKREDVLSKRIKHERSNKQQLQDKFAAELHQGTVEVGKKLQTAEKKVRHLSFKLMASKMVKGEPLKGAIGAIDTVAEENINWDMVTLTDMLVEGLEDGRLEQALLLLPHGPGDLFEQVVVQVVHTAQHLLKNTSNTNSMLDNMLTGAGWMRAPARTRRQGHEDTGPDPQSPEETAEREQQLAQLGQELATQQAKVTGSPHKGKTAEQMRAAGFSDEMISEGMQQREQLAAQQLAAGGSTAAGAADGTGAHALQSIAQLRASRLSEADIVYEVQQRMMAAEGATTTAAAAKQLRAMGLSDAQLQHGASEFAGSTVEELRAIGLSDEEIQDELRQRDLLAAAHSMGGGGPTMMVQGGGSTMGMGIGSEEDEIATEIASRQGHELGTGTAATIHGDKSLEEMRAAGLSSEAIDAEMTSRQRAAEAAADPELATKSAEELAELGLSEGEIEQEMMRRQRAQPHHEAEDNLLARLTKHANLLQEESAELLRATMHGAEIPHRPGRGLALRGAEMLVLQSLESMSMIYNQFSDLQFHLTSDQGQEDLAAKVTHGVSRESQIIYAQLQKFMSGKVDAPTLQTKIETAYANIKNYEERLCGQLHSSDAESGGGQGGGRQRTLTKIVNGKPHVVTMATVDVQTIEPWPAQGDEKAGTGGKAKGRAKASPSSKKTTEAQELEMLNRQKKTKDHSYHSHELTKVVSGVQPMAVKAVKKHAAELLMSKIKADLKNGAIRQALPDFVQNSLMSRYGLKKIAVKNIRQLAAGVRKYSNPTQVRYYDRLVHIFGRLSGILSPESYSSMAANFVMDLLELLYCNNHRLPAKVTDKIADSLLHDRSVSFTLVKRALETLLIAYRSPATAYERLFTKIDADGSNELNLCELAQMLEGLGEPTEPADVEHVMGQVDLDGGGSISLGEFAFWWKRFGCLSSRLAPYTTSGVCSVLPERGDTVVVPLLKLIELTYEHWEQIEDTIPVHDTLLAAFKLHDVNHDACLNGQEFAGLVAAVDLAFKLREAGAPAAAVTAALASGDFRAHGLEWERPQDEVAQIFEKALHETRTEDDEQIMSAAFLTAMHSFHVGMDKAGWERKEAARAELATEIMAHVGSFSFSSCTLHISGMRGLLMDEDMIQLMMAPFGKVVQVTLWDRPEKLRQQQPDGPTWGLISFLTEDVARDVVAHNANMTEQRLAKAIELAVEMWPRLHPPEARTPGHVLEGLTISPLSPAACVTSTTADDPKLAKLMEMAKARANKSLAEIRESES